MKKLLSLGILAIFLVSCSVFYQSLQKTSSGRLNLQLIQNYEIHAVRGQTLVSASVKFWDTQNNRYHYPRKVEFNGQPMNNELLDRSKQIETGCRVSDDILRGREASLSNRQLEAEPSDFSLILGDYQSNNTVTIYDERGVAQSYEIHFEPVQPARTESLTLSRSKDNLIQLKGAGGEKKDPIFGLTQPDGGTSDPKLFRYHLQNNALTIPAKAIKGLKPGNANFWIISSEAANMETPGVITGNSYIALFNDMICVQITD